MAIEFRKVNAKQGGGSGGVRKGYYMVKIEASPQPTTNPKYCHQIALKFAVIEGVKDDGTLVTGGTFRQWQKVQDYDKQSEAAANVTADILVGAIQAANPDADVAAEFTDVTLDDEEAGLAQIAALLDGKTAAVHYEPRDLRREKGPGNYENLDWLSAAQYENAKAGSFRIAPKVITGGDMSKPTPANGAAAGSGMVVPPKKGGGASAATKNVKALLGA